MDTDAASQSVHDPVMGDMAPASAPVLGVEAEVEAEVEAAPARARSLLRPKKPLLRALGVLETENEFPARLFFFKEDDQDYMHRLRARLDVRIRVHPEYLDTGVSIYVKDNDAYDIANTKSIVYTHVSIVLVYSLCASSVRSL